MIELIFSALVTILPDYLYRRFAQGKRIGHEITLFSFWYELRWGLTGCAILAITLITVIFYFHPTTSHVISLFRTVSIISDQAGRVEEVYVRNNQGVAAGEPIFRLETSRQRAAAQTARLRIAEVDAALSQAETELDVAAGEIRAADGLLREARDELARNEDIVTRNATLVTEQELARLRAVVESRSGSVDAARARRTALESTIETVLPAQRASAEAALAQAQVEIEQATVRAGTDGTVKQFFLKPGDIVNPILRPAGILVPAESGRGTFQAGFQQISAQVLHEGMLMEITCASKPLTVLPMVVREIQDAIAAGQLRPTDQLVDVQERVRPGTIIATLRPVFPDSLAYAVPPGSHCVGVGYSDHSAQIASGEARGLKALALRVVDGMGIANALVIRAQALLLPIRAIVFSG
jgi:multidrug resistance efflux pump